MVESGPMQELVFEVTQEADGGYIAESLGEGVITQADTWDELRRNVREAVEAYFFDSTPPKHIRLRSPLTPLSAELGDQA